MSVTAYRLTRYWIECDNCGTSECCPNSYSEGVHSKQEAIKWAKMHKIKNGDILCDECFNKYKENKNGK